MKINPIDAHETHTIDLHKRILKQNQPIIPRIKSKILSIVGNAITNQPITLRNANNVMTFIAKNHAPDILVIGDIHLKASKIANRVMNAVKRIPSINRVIFLGDLNDDWNVGSGERVQCMKDFLTLHHQLEHAGLEVTTLIGNHDASYLPHVDSTSLDFRNTSPGHDYGSEREIQKIVAQIPDLKAAELITVNGKPTIFTHAGITESWLMRNMPDNMGSPEKIVEGINQMMDDGNWRSLYTIGHARGGLRSTTPSPLWADKTELEYDPAEGFDQIVGHTPVSGIESVKISCNHHASEDSITLTFCDTLSCYSNDDPIGDGSFLLINNKNGKMMGLTSNGDLEPVPIIDL